MSEAVELTGKRSRTYGAISRPRADPTQQGLRDRRALVLAERPVVEAPPVVHWGRLASAIRRPRALWSLAAQFKVSAADLSFYLRLLKRQGLVSYTNNLWSLIDG